MEKQIFLLLALALVLAQAGPLTNRNQGQCVQTCPISDKPSTYEVGKSYTYNYMTRVRSHIKGASEESTGLRLSAKVVLDVLTPCEISMRMVDVKVSELDPANGEAWIDSPRQNDYEYELSNTDVHFAWNDGTISHVCSATDELDWVLNIKKAAISMLQNSSPNKLKAFDGVESDISGKCRVSYKPVAASNSLLSSTVTVQKDTDLMSCIDQQRIRSSFQSSSYRVPARIQSLPLTKANRSCSIDYFSAGSLQKARCTEEHVLRPFSEGSDGARTLVEQEMEFVGVGGQVRVSHSHQLRRSKLEYTHHEPLNTASTSSVEDVRSVLRRLCDLGPTVATETPIVFNQLLHRLRKLSSDQLMTVRKEVESLSVCRRNNKMARQFFFDALPVVLTSASTEVMKDLILSGKVSMTEAQMWLTSLAFVQKPTKEMLESLAPLLEVEQPNQQAQLGIGALVHQFCKTEPECQRQQVLKRIAAAFGKILGDDCSSADRKAALVALKSIGNAGHLIDLMPRIVKCAAREANSMDIRVAAIEALRRSPCSVDRAPLMRLIGNKDADSELRITAYLGLMTCPSAELFATVKELLKAESSNQFASFMWTHLTNLMETSDPHKQDIRVIVEDVKLKSQYDLDKLKFSRNVEKSFFSTYLNAGAKVESNLIWSQKSFLPRSATLNMTLDLFGKSFNFLEIGGRVQGMETLLEKYLGPKGMEKRKTQDPDTKLAALDNTFKLIEDKIGGNLDVKIFGHQIAFLDLWKEDLMRSKSSLLELLTSLKQLRELNFHKSFSFLDTEVTLPTISGFPLKLSINGTASFLVKAKTELNMQKLMQWPPQFEAGIHIAPSGAVHVSGLLGIETFYGSYGVKMATTAFTNTETKATVKTSNAEEFLLEVSEPRSKQNIFNIKNKFYLVHRSVEREQTVRKDLIASKKVCSSGFVFEKVLGLEFCADMKFPNLLRTDGAAASPMGAGYEFDVAMYKRDTHEKYLIHLVNQKNGLNRHLKVLLDTPGSRIDRKIQAEFLLDASNYKMNAILSTPWKKANAKFEINSVSEGVRDVIASAEADGRQFGQFSAQCVHEMTGSQLVYKIRDAQVTVMGVQSAKVSALASLGQQESEKDYRLKISVTPQSSQEMMVDSLLKVNAEGANAKFEVKSTEFAMNFNSNQKFGQRMTGNTVASFQFTGQEEKKMEAKYHLMLQSEPSLQINAGGEMRMSAYPQYDMRVMLQAAKLGRFNSNADISLTFAQSNEAFRVQHKYQVDEADSNHAHKWTVSVVSPWRSFGFVKSLSHNSDWTVGKSELTVDNNGEMHKTSLHASRAPGTFFHTADFQTTVYGEELVLQSSWKQSDEEASTQNFLTKLTLAGKKYQLDGSLQQPSSRLRLVTKLNLPNIQEATIELAADSSADAPGVKAKIESSFGILDLDVSSQLSGEAQFVNGKLSFNDRHYNASASLKDTEAEKKAEVSAFWNIGRADQAKASISTGYGFQKQPHSLKRQSFLILELLNKDFQISTNEDYVPYIGKIDMNIISQKKELFNSEFNYNINDGWTEKGIVATLNIHKKFGAQKEIRLKLDGYGSLRIRKLMIECDINQKRFKADLLINLGNINNFNSRLNIVLPYKGLSFMKFELTHWLTSSELKSKLDMDFNTKKMVVDVQAFDKSNSDERDVGLKLKTESTLRWLPALDVDFQHKDDGKKFSTINEAVCNGQKVSLSSQFTFYPVDDHLESKGNVSLWTPLSGFEEMSVQWNHRHTSNIVRTQSKITYQRGKSIDFSLNAYNDVTPHGDREIGVTTSVTSPFSDEAAVKFVRKLKVEKEETTARITVPIMGTYTIDALKDNRAKKSHVKFTTPHTLSKFGAVHSTREHGNSESSSSSEIYWNDELIKLQGKYLPSRSSNMIEVTLQTPFESMKLERLLVQYSGDAGKKTEMEFYHNAEKMVSLMLNSETSNNGIDKYSAELETRSQILNSFKVVVQKTWNFAKKELQVSSSYNEEYSASMQATAEYLEASFNIIGKLSTTCPRGSKRLVITHKHNSQSIVSVMKADGWTDDSITIKSNIDVTRGILDLEAVTPFAAASSSKLHMSVSRQGAQLKSDLLLQHVFYHEMLKLEMEAEASGLTSAAVQLSLNSPESLFGVIKAKLSHSISSDNGWQVAADANFPGGRIDVKGHTEMNSDVISAKWSIRTPFTAFEQLALSFTHQQEGYRVQHQHECKLLIANNDLQFSNKIKLEGAMSIRLQSELSSNLLSSEGLSLNFRQDISDQQFYNGELKLSHGETEFGFDLDLKKETSGFHGSASLTTPFEILSEFSTNARLSFTDLWYWTASTKTSLRTRAGSFNFEKEFALRGLKTSSASVKFNSPWTALSGNWSHDALRPGTVTAQGEVILNGVSKKMTSKLETISSGLNKLTVQVTDLPKIVAETNWVSNDKLELSLLSGEKPVFSLTVNNVDSSLSLETAADAFGVSHKTSLQIQVERNEMKMKFKLNCNHLQSPIELKFECTRDHTKMLGLSGQMELKSQFFDKASGLLTIDMDNLSKGKSTFELKVPTMKRICYGAEWNFMTDISADLRLELPHVQEVEFKLRSNEDGIQISMEMPEMFDDKWEMTVGGHVQSMLNSRIAMNLRTPLNSMRTVHLQHSHNFESGQQLSTELQLPHWNKKAVLKISSSANRISLTAEAPGHEQMKAELYTRIEEREAEVKFSAQCAQLFGSQDLQLNFKLASHQTETVVAEIKIPTAVMLRHYSAIQLRLDADVSRTPSTAFNIEIQGSTSAGQPMAQLLKSTYGSVSDRRVWTLAMPIGGFTVSHGNQESQLSIKYEDKSVEITQKSKITSIDDFEVQITGKVADESEQKFQMTLQNRKEQDVYKNKILILFNGNNLIHFTGDVKCNTEELKASLSLSTPFTDDMHLRFGHKGHALDFSHFLQITSKYHTPIVYKGQFSDFTGDFSASVPVIGETRVQLRLQSGKSSVAVFMNKLEKLSVQVNNKWNGLTGSTKIKVTAFGEEVVARIENNGDRWQNFMTKLSLTTSRFEYAAELGHEKEKLMHILLEVRPFGGKTPLHSFIFSISKDRLDFLADILVVMQHETVYGFSAKSELWSILSMTLNTNIRGLRHISLTGKLTKTAAIFEMDNDYIRKNVVRIEKHLKDQVNFIFDSEILGRYSLNFIGQPKQDSTNFKRVQVELHLPNTEPLVLKMEHSLSYESILAAVELQTPFKQMTDSKLKISGTWTAELKELTLKFKQDVIGSHGVSMQVKPTDKSVIGDFKIVSDIHSINQVSMHFDLSALQQQVKFFSNKFGQNSFVGKFESSEGKVHAVYELTAPFSHIMHTTFTYSQTCIEGETKVRMEINNPTVGKNHLDVQHRISEEADKKKLDFELSLFIENLNELVKVQSTVMSAADGKEISGSGSHSFEARRLGKYSLTESLQLSSLGMSVSFAFDSPFTNWEHSTASLQVETKDIFQTRAEIITKTYGSQVLSLLVKENVMTLEMTIMSQKNQLIISGWKPKINTNGEDIIDFHVSIDTRMHKATLKLNLENGQIRVVSSLNALTTDDGDVIELKKSASGSLTWNLQPGRILLDAKAVWQSGMNSAVVGASIDLDASSEYERRLIMRLAAPIRSIGASELALVLKLRPVLDASVVVQSPILGEFKTKVLLQSGNGLLRAPITAKAMVQSSFESVPSYEVAFTTAQEVETLFVDLNLKNLRSSEIQFKAGAVCDLHKKELKLNGGRNRDLILKWKSDSDFANIEIDETLHVMWNRERYSLKMKYSTVEKTVASFIVKTPFAGIEKFGFKLVLAAPMPFHVEGKIILPGDEIDAKVVVDFADGVHLRAGIHVPHFPRGELAVQSTGSLKNYKFETTGEYENVRFSVLSHWDLTENPMLKLRVETPANDLKLAEILLKLDRQDQDQNLKVALTYNENMLKFSTNMNRKKMFVRVNAMGNTYTAMLKKTLHSNNKAWRVFLLRNDEKLVEVAGRLSSLLADKKWPMRVPHSGFLEVNHLFDLLNGRSMIEWDLQTVGSWWRTVHDFSAFVRVEHNGNYVSHLMSLVNDRKLTLKSTANVPALGIRNQEITGSIDMSTDTAKHNRISIDLDVTGRKVQVTLSTDWKSSIHAQVTGVSGLSFAKDNTIFVQSHVLSSDLVSEFSFKLIGLKRGDIVALLRGKNNGKSLMDLNVELRYLEDYLLDFNTVSQMRRGWLGGSDSSSNGRLMWKMPNIEVHSVTWSGSATDDKLVFDVSSVSGPTSANTLLKSTTVIAFKDGIQVSFQGRTSSQSYKAELDMRPRKLEIELTQNSQILLKVASECRSSGSSNRLYNQNLLVEYMGTKLVTLLANQQLHRQIGQMNALVKLNIIGFKSVFGIESDSVKRKLDVAVSLPEMQFASVSIDFYSWLKPVIKVRIGQQQIIANLDHSSENGAFATEIGVSNPWMPIKVQLQHNHQNNYHSVEHHYQVGERKYLIKGQLSQQKQVTDTSLYYESPSRKLKVAANLNPTRFSHSVQYNGENVLQMQAGIESAASSGQEYLHERKATAQVTSKYLPSIELNAVHHHNGNWRDCRWQHHVNVNQQRWLSHSGHLRVHTRELSSELRYLHHHNKLEVGNGRYQLMHTIGSRNVGHLSGSYSWKASSMRFSHHTMHSPVSVDLRHHFGHNEGLVAFSSSDKTTLPTVQASWNLNRPSLRSELKVHHSLGNMNLRLNHIHHANSDFEFKHELEITEHKHELSGKFELKPSAQGFRRELIAGAALKSSQLAPVAFKLHHQCDDWKNNKVAASGQIGNWKLTHHSTVSLKDRQLNLETVVARGNVQLVQHSTKVQGGVYKLSTKFRDNSLYHLEGHCSPMTTKVIISSDYFGLTSETEIDHNIQSLTKGKISVSHKGLLPKFHAESNWDLEGNHRQLELKLNSMSALLQLNNRNNQLTFNAELKNGFELLKLRTEYDPEASCIRKLPLMFVRVQSKMLPTQWIQWSHRLSQSARNHAELKFGADLGLDVKANWDLNSEAKYFQFDFADVKVQITEGKADTDQQKFRLQVTVQSEIVSASGVLKAAENWKDGTISISSGQQKVLNGDWNCQDVEKQGNFQLENLKLKLRMKRNSLTDFEINHSLECDSCFARDYLPSPLKLMAKVQAADNWQSGMIKANATLGPLDQLPVAADWDFTKDVRSLNIKTSIMELTLSNKRSQYPNFNYEQTINFLGTAHKLSAALDVQSGEEFEHRITGHLNCPLAQARIDHSLSGLRQHKWQHAAEFGQWKFSANGQHQLGHSLESEIAVHRNGQQLIGKQLKWNPQLLEYQDSFNGMKMHHFQATNTEAKKSMWFKTDFYHRIVGAGVTMQKTCDTCYDVTLKIGSKTVPNLLNLNGEYRANEDFIKVTVNHYSGDKVEVEFKGKPSNFEFKSSVAREGEFKYELKSESRVEKLDDIFVNVGCTVTERSTVSDFVSFVFQSQGDMRDLKQKTILSILNSEKIKQTLNTKIVSATEWSSSFDLETEIFGVGKFSGNAAMKNGLRAKVTLGEKFLEITADDSYHLLIKSSCTTIPAIEFRMQLSPETNKLHLQSTVSYRQETLSAIFELENTETKKLRIQLETPFPAARLLKAAVSASIRRESRLSASASLQVNDWSYSTAFDAKKELTGLTLQRSLTWETATPHEGFEKISLHLASSKSEVNAQGIIAMALNDHQFKFNATRSFQVDQQKAQIRITMPGQQFVQTDLNGKIVSNGVFSSVTGSAVLTSSFDRLRNAQLDIAHTFNDNRLEHSSSLRVQNQQRHQMIIRASAEDGEISFGSWAPVKINYKLKIDNSIESELKVTYKDTVPFEVKSRIAINNYAVEGDSFMSLRTPYRTVKVNREIKWLNKGLSYKLEFNPNQGVTQPIVMEVEIQDKSDFTKSAVSAKSSLQLPTRTISVEVDHIGKPEKTQMEAKINWDAKKSNNKVIALKLEANQASRSEFSSKLQLQVADKRPYSIEMDWNFGNGRTVINSNLKLDITDRRENLIALGLNVEKISPEILQIESSLNQVSSSIDFKLSGNLKLQSGSRDGDLIVKYVDASGQLRETRTAVHISSTRLSFNLISPERTCSFDLQKVVDEQQTAYLLKTHGREFEIRLSQTPSVELLYTPSANDRVSASFGYVNSRHLRVDIHRVTDQVKMQHLLAEVQLQTQHLLKTKIHWNPTYAMLHYSTLKYRLPSLYTNAVEMARSIDLKCIQDLGTKVSRDIVLPDLSSAGQFVENELSLLAADVDYVKQQFTEMHSRNEFFSRDISEFLSSAASKISASAAQIVESITGTYTQHLHPHVSRAWNHSQILVAKLVFIAKRHGKAGAAHVIRVYEVVRSPMRQLYHNTNQKVIIIIDATVDGMRPAMEAAFTAYMRAIAAYSHYHVQVFKHPIAQAVNRGWNSIPEAADAYRTLQSMAPTAYARVQLMHNATYNRLNSLAEQTAEKITIAKRWIIKNMNDFIKNRHAQLATTLVSGFYEKCRWFLDTFNIEENLKDFAKDNYLQAVEYLRQNSIGLAIDYLGVGQSAVLQNNPTQGKFEARIYSPLKWYDLQSMPTSGLEDVRARLGSSCKSVRNSIKTLQRKIRAIGDVVYDSIPDFDMPSGSWIPKFKGIASVQGSNVITFDGMHYRFRSGLCSYLLARDFRTRRWAVTMENVRNSRNVNIHAYDKVITVQQDSRVTVDGENVELPLRIGNLSVVNMGNGKILVKDRLHLFTVVVDPQLEAVTMSVTGWYHGRLAGLFGNFDNEQFNDQISSTGYRTDSQQEFLRSWKLGSCSQTQWTVPAVRKSVQEQQNCEHLFSSSRSPYRRCFGLINSQPFLEMCQRDSQCNAAAIYIRHCRIQGIRGMKQPNRCKRCSVQADGESHELLMGHKVSRTIRRRKAEVVFVVEERGCVGARTVEQLPQMVRKMETSLRSSGINDVKFSLMAFGNPEHGSGKPRPHWHTAEGVIQGLAQSMEKAFNRLSLNNDGDWRSDPLDAVYSAAFHGEFSSDAAKHIVLVSCSECHDGRRTLRSTRAALHEANIQLHLLHESRMSTFFGRRGQAFGVNAIATYSSEAPEGSDTLLQFTKKPSGKCATLAVGSGGSVFDLRYLRRRNYRAFAGSFSRSFSEQLARSSSTAVHEECTCGNGSDSQPLRCRRE